MGRLGISLYPEHSTPERDKEYIQLAGKYGFQRIFTCLLSVGNKNKDEMIHEFRDMIDTAHEYGMEVILDVAPPVFEALGASYDNLAPFKEMHADGIRLDIGFDGMKEAAMSYNCEGLKIELNASTDPSYVSNIMNHHPVPERIITCHNFYPQKYTGISLEHFDYCNREMKKHGLKVAAFVSSNNGNTFGPWPVNEGLCTLEMHRGLPVDAQVRHLLATRMVDDVIIANAYASEEELKACASVIPGKLMFGLCLEKELTETEREILYFDRQHVIRGDISEYMIRSTWPRVVFADKSVPPANTRDLKRGDVVILNDGYSRYKGELHVVLKDMPNDGRKNVIGHIPDYELVLLDYIKPWKLFGFTEVSFA
ncbi:DUF871 domain-containing protein [Lacrimispora celerecrescens]|uniref:Outer surface protein n=1 Tax=[Clostridium] celerecrescens 18A TaxID=1286362 RepID=A0A2M8Z8P9_9FIRM|nr:MupG family TIM beta-alpha barrel fold protein [Lacrimispora celerecrescens]PJJ29794.1 hypothetical protein H171_3352 [[Clostridium] celerecrescens 18A]